MYRHRKAFRSQHAQDGVKEVGIELTEWSIAQWNGRGSGPIARDSLGNVLGLKIQLEGEGIGSRADELKRSIKQLSVGQAEAAHLAGRIRIIGITAPQRQRNAGALAAVPTWREQGIAVEVDNLRGVIGPKAMSTAQIAYWEGALARVVATPEWKTHLEKNQWTDSFAGAQASRKILAQQHDEMRTGLAALGMVK